MLAARHGEVSAIQPASADTVPTAEIEARPNVDAVAREQIRQFVSQHVASHRLTDLVAAVLAAQGFQTS